MNISQKGRRTNLSLREIALVLTELNELNFPSTQNHARRLSENRDRSEERLPLVPTVLRGNLYSSFAVHTHSHGGPWERVCHLERSTHDSTSLSLVTVSIPGQPPRPLPKKVSRDY